MPDDPLEMSEADRTQLARCARNHHAAYESLRGWLKSRPALTCDKLEAIVDLVEVTLGFTLVLQHQLDRLDAGLSMSMDDVLPAAESAMLRACALEVQLAGGSFVSQHEHYSQPIQP